MEEISLRSPQGNAFKCIPCDSRTLSFCMGTILIAIPMIVRGVCLHQSRVLKALLRSLVEFRLKRKQLRSLKGLSPSNHVRPQVQEKAAQVSQGAVSFQSRQTSGPRESSPGISRSSQKLLSASIVRQPASLRRSLNRRSTSVGVTLPNQQCHLSISAARAP